MLVVELKELVVGVLLLEREVLVSIVGGGCCCRGSYN